MLDWKSRIVVDPEIYRGKAVIKGTRVMVSVILADLADGTSREEILESYPTITEPDIDAALYYAATLANESVLPVRLDSGGNR